MAPEGIRPKASMVPVITVQFQKGVRLKAKWVLLEKNKALKQIRNKAWRAGTQREQSSKPRRKFTLKLKGHQDPMSPIGSVGTSTCLLISVGVVEGLCWISLLITSNVNLRNKTTSYFTSKR